MRSRDLIGYGGRPPTVVWPNGARLAVSLVVNFEEGAELAIGDGDERNERAGEIASVVEPGQRDFGQEEMFAYGMRAGFWRFLDALARPSLPPKPWRAAMSPPVTAGCGARMPISPIAPRSGRR
jgi:hypothetical protein